MKCLILLSLTIQVWLCSARTVVFYKKSGCQGDRVTLTKQSWIPSAENFNVGFFNVLDNQGACQLTINGRKVWEDPNINKVTHVTQDNKRSTCVTNSGKTYKDGEIMTWQPEGEVRWMDCKMIMTDPRSRHPFR